jgi:hypothetical protein
MGEEKYMPTHTHTLTHLHRTMEMISENIVKTALKSAILEHNK